MENHRDLPGPAAGRTHRNTRADRDSIYTVIIWGAALLISAVFLIIIGNLIWNGAGKISWEFLTQPPLNAGRDGGISSILVSTALILGVSISVSLPIGLGTSIYLSEFTSAESKSGRFVRRSLDILAGIPSIVFGLFGFALFTKILGLGFSILSGGLTLACMVLPMLIRSTEEGFRSVPAEYRLGAAALGLSRITTIFRILLPVAIPGLIAGVVLGTGRAIAETAALLFTSGYVDRMPTSLLDSGRALSVHIFDLSLNVPGGNQNAYASALVLITIFLFINITAALIGKYWIKGRT
ncbi:MAG: phosphate ABC transporter permease PstA [Deltaproteobacteria bacterium]